MDIELIFPPLIMPNRTALLIKETINSGIDHIRKSLTNKHCWLYII